jgi:hypothetical protein
VESIEDQVVLERVSFLYEDRKESWEKLLPDNLVKKWYCGQYNFSMVSNLQSKILLGVSLVSKPNLL